MKNLFIKKRNFNNKNSINKKMILYISATLIFAAVPVSVIAAEENAQTSSSPEVNTPSDSQTQESPSPEASKPEESPGNASSETSSPDNSNTNSSNTAEKPDGEASPSQTSSTDAAITPQPESTPQPTPTDNATNNNYDVTPMQGTFYAATDTGLNVRSGPSTNHSKVGTLKYGQEITVTGKTADNWYQIQYSGGTGYVLADYVSNDPLTGSGSHDTQTPSAGTSDAEPSNMQTPDTEYIDIGDIPDEENSMEAEDATDSADNYYVETTKLFGTPVIVTLVLAILGVVALIGFSVYSLFKRDNAPVDSENDYNEDNGYSDDMYYEDEQYPNDEYYEDKQYTNDNYSDDNYSDDEYYEDEQYSDNNYSDDEYYEDEQYSDDNYSDGNYSDDEYYEDEYYEEDDKNEIE